MATFLRVLNSLERFIVGTLMLLMVGLYSLAILVRQFVPTMARDVAWIDEATRYMLVWLVFLALGTALGAGRQISMDTFLLGFSERFGKIVRKVIDLTGLLFSLYIAWVGVELTMMIAGTGQKSPTLHISAAYLYLALPAGFLLLALRYAMSLFGLIDRWSSAAHES
ncbi:MAG TPA: TRAP transporter small permease subunit [Devosia sp.]|nr:TRAP transporter small permease subunit [Devosia sp.]